MKCPQCGYDVEQSFKFCPDCAFKLLAQPVLISDGNLPEQRGPEGSEVEHKVQEESSAVGNKAGTSRKRSNENPRGNTKKKKKERKKNKKKTDVSGCSLPPCSTVVTSEPSDTSVGDTESEKDEEATKPTGDESSASEEEAQHDALQPTSEDSPSIPPAAASTTQLARSPTSTLPADTPSLLSSPTTSPVSSTTPTLLENQNKISPSPSTSDQSDEVITSQTQPPTSPSMLMQESSTSETANQNSGGPDPVPSQPLKKISDNDTEACPPPESSEDSLTVPSAIASPTQLPPPPTSTIPADAPDLPSSPMTPPDSETTSALPENQTRVSPSSSTGDPSNEMITSQMQPPTSPSMLTQGSSKSETGNQKVGGPGPVPSQPSKKLSYRDALQGAVAESEDLHQESNGSQEKGGVTAEAPQSSGSQSNKTSKDAANSLQHSTEKSDKTQTSYNKQMFGPFKGGDTEPGGKNVNKNQHSSKENKLDKKQTKDRGTEKTAGDGDSSGASSPALPSPEEKDLSPGRSDEVGQVSSENQQKDMQTQLPQSTPNRQQGPSDLTIYFHAILSKDFKLDPSKDVVSIKSDHLVGNWQGDALKMEITQNLGDHGFLVEGHLTTSKQIVGSSVPYKYVVTKWNKSNQFHHEFEYIYKPHATPHFVNRCLLIKDDLLTQQGEWHQYDDIICAEPPKDLLSQFKNWLSEKKNDIVKGRHLAGKVMLETIFDLLRTWTLVNVKNFFVQLQQFFVTYSNPYIYEERAKPWTSLQYGTAEVRNLLTQFMQERIFHQEGGTNVFFSDPVKAGVIILLVYNKYKLQLDTSERFSSLCNLLCLPQKPRESFCLYWTEFTEALQEEGVTYAVQMLCSPVIRKKNTQWILVLPLLHLLRGNSKPFEPSCPSIDSEFDTWAGLDGITMPEVHTTDSQHTRALMKVMEAHKHLLEVDRLLARSWMCLLGLNDLVSYISIISVDILDILVRLRSSLNSGKSYFGQEMVKQLLSHLFKKVRDQECSFQDGKYGELCLKMSVRLLGTICRNFKEPCHNEIHLECLRLLSVIVDVTECYSPQSTEATKGQLKCKGTVVVLGETIQIMREWLRTTFRGSLLNRSYSYIAFSNVFEIEVWNKLTSLTFANEEFSRQWRDTFLNQFEGKLKQESSIHQIEIYFKKMEDVTEKYPSLSASVERCALEAVTFICQEKSESVLFERLKGHDFSKFGRLVSAIVLKSWPKTAQGEYQEGEELVVKHLLSWPTAKNVFQIQGTKGKLIDQLTDDARERMAVASSALCSVSDQFIQGNIQMKILNQILEGETAFIELLKMDGLCDDGRCKDSRAMKNLLRERRKEVEDVYHEKEMVECLLNVCRKLQEPIKGDKISSPVHTIQPVKMPYTVDVEELERKHQTNIELMTLDEFMEVHQLDGRRSEVTGLVTYFNLCDNTRKMAEELHTFRDNIFAMCWENQAKALSPTHQDSDETEPEPCTLELIHSDIFQPCYSKYESIYTALKSGTLPLKDVDNIFEDYKGKYEDMTKDLEIMCKIDPSDNKRWIKKRVQQIRQYHELHSAVESAQVIMDAKETLGLQGDFQILETLIEVNGADFKEVGLNRIDDNLMNAKEVLVDITEPRRQCLQELHFRRNFVLWVKEALKDINELKVFVDLASISAGENDMDVDRVACFHDAVLGYSSMLYGLSLNADFKAFKEAAEKLWQALENDSHISKKLRDTARHLEWLKTVKESHGSVELSSLSLATTINTKGVYIISAQNQRKLSLDTALRLQVQEEHEEGQEMRSYSLEDLRELQNKLMLMSGKGEGQIEVDHFTEVFDAVQRLAMAFIDLFAAGNPLFRHWEAKIDCSALNGAGIVMDFNLSNTQGQITIEGNAVEQLPVVCRKMERYLRCWKDFMDKQRSQLYYLNYYTAEQVVYLCNQLSQNNMNEELEDQVLMMLSFINTNCTVANVWKAWITVCDSSTNTPGENEDIDFKTFLEIHDGEAADSSLIGDEECSTNRMQDALDKAAGLRKLDILLYEYIRDMKTFLPDTLDVKSLGRLLDKLAHTVNWDDEDEDDEDFMPLDPKEKPIRRDLPKGLMSGRPNLIVCPHDEILASCISVYMSSEYETLPTYDEVLLCTAATPYEQVEIFLRRCLTPGYLGEKIYSLLYADQLSYEVSYAVEEFFQKLSLCCRENYKFVIICSSDREHAYIPSAFSQFKLPMVPQEPLKRIQMYLSRHYVVPSDQASAATVFKGRQFVGTVSSKRAGVGKSLYIQRLYEKLDETASSGSSSLRCIRLIEPRVNENVILQSLLDTPQKEGLVVFHLDVTSLVQKGLQEFLFKLLVLHYLMDSEGRMWKCSNKHLYVVEMLQSSCEPPRFAPRSDSKRHFTLMEVFPNIFCCPPKEVLELEIEMENDPALEDEDPLMDDQHFRSEAYQRPYQYLKRFHKGDNLDSFTYSGVEGTHSECLQMLFFYCGIMDPSWAELRNFARFLNLQLQDCETSDFCDMTLVGDTLRGFKNFVVDFMILMAKDFATPSLSITDQSPGRQQVDLAGINEKDLAPFRIRKRWESEPHPYIFFNDDHVSMTFIGFHLKTNKENMVDAMNPSTNTVIRKNVMTNELYNGLRLQRVPFNIDFDSLPRSDKIERLCSVLGIKWPSDPDDTYELTMDNILKMMAIHMRFRCGIPVIIMGETGCGKTRLIKFMCELRRSGAPTENMKLVKVHGGTTSDMIYTKVREAEAIASANKEEHGFNSVLFFDEANTTEAVSSIKEVLCDNTAQGQKLAPQSGLQIIAACNPYRKHSEEMIKRLEAAGLGYRVRAEETEDRLGSIPLRQLVYRVQVLPPSMIPLVWDFGQLNDNTEKMYIQQIVQKVVETSSIKKDCIKMITDVLSSSQGFMRKKKDECSFVSLRDVERCMQVFVWFYSNHAMFFEELGEFLKNGCKSTRSGGGHISSEVRDPVVWSLLMAVGVCYHACLEKKKEFWTKICKWFPTTYKPQKVMQEISAMQDLFLNSIPLGNTIARNKALKENVFMMVVCIELRIPLFLVGKPGSSKSLSKTLVADLMQGQAAHSELYRKLKQIHLVSYQCSPHSTPEGIINTFKQCARFQEGKNLKEYISVVVLDEIGLAEDSPKMPLKTLHPLLEEGCIDDDPLPHKKVGFIGISNWALDPAKMNRGIFVSRGDPDQHELMESAIGICSSDKMILEKVRHLFQPFAVAYLRICEKQGNGFFGLRDYYSLIKMVFAVTKTTKLPPSTEQIVEMVVRNFSGWDGVPVVAVFAKRLYIQPNLDHINAIDLVKQNIHGIGQEEDCRYLLILTKNFAALQILQQMFFSDHSLPEIIFGSSFPKDQEYTQICKNINRVKICMETGRTVVLLNLQNLYESLYDALNQYYVSLGGQKYVDLGLGTHRVKCRVHKDFRLIVIEEKEVVYKQFPIPLINRLEKHYLDINTVLKSDQKEIVKHLTKWVQQFVSLNSQHSTTHTYLPPDVFIGYHSDTCSSVVLQVMEKLKGESDVSDTQRRVLEEAKLILLNCATPDSVVRLEYTKLSDVETEHLARVYFEEQKHCSLTDFIFSHTHQEVWHHAFFTEVTTFSRLLTAADIDQLQNTTEIGSIELLSLQQFETEYSFLKKIRQFLDSTSADKILIIQMDFGEDSSSANILASAKYSSINEISRSRGRGEQGRVFVYFITKLPRMEGGTSYVGFQGGPWMSIHIDDLRSSKDIVSDVQALRNLSISQLFEEKMEQPEGMEVENTERDQPEPELFALDSVFDTTALVRSCVQSAVSMLRDQEDSGIRSTRRVEILLSLLDSEELRASFLETLKRRLHSLLEMHDGNVHMPQTWVIREASNINALHEGGTFKHTLWRRVQAVVTPLLAHLVSVIDRNCNLDLLLDSNCGEEVRNLWLNIFDNKALLDIPFIRVDHNTESQSILVQSHVSANRTMACALPFSWRIKDLLDELWVHTRKHKGHVFEKTWLGQYFAGVDKQMQREFFQRYLQDFITMTMKVTSEGELELLRAALTSCVNELQRRHGNVPGEGLSFSLPWVHSAYHEFQNRLQNLSRMMSIQPQVVFDLLRNPRVREGAEMVLDLYAALACVEHLEPRGDLDVDAQRLAWLRQVKRLQVPIELVCSEHSLRQYGERSREMVQHIRNGWRRIFSMSLFVEHMLLGIESEDERLKPLIIEHIHRLGKVLEKSSDVKLEKTFVAVIEILKSCKQRASDHIFRYGLQSCAVCMGEPQDPMELPCNHIFCLPCIRRWLTPDQMYCPKCTQPVADDLYLRVSEDIRGLFSLNAQFRRRCNAFFIELVSSMCFKDNSPPSKGVILHLLSFLMVEIKPVAVIQAHSRILTKALSPFDECLDMNPVVRSVVLKLLLKYSFDDVREYLQQHLTSIEESNILEGVDKNELYALYINCLEDSMIERQQVCTVAEQQRCLQDGRDFLRYFLHSGRVAAEAVSIESLQQVARLRLCLDTAAQLLIDRPSGECEKLQAEFLSTVSDLCETSRNDWYRVYLIRKISSQQGIEFVQRMLSEAELQWLFPEEILQQDEDAGQMDPFLVYGEDYKTVREAVATAAFEGRVEGIDETCEKCAGPPRRRAVYILLALFREVTALYRAANTLLHPKPEQCKALEDFIQGSRFLVTQEMKEFATALVHNRLGALSVQRGRPNTEHVLLELVVHLAAVLLCGSEVVLSPLKQLGVSPTNMQGAFLPTMPEDMLAVAQKALGFTWYTCPNGHPCVVDRCGQPTETARCLECGALVGGQSHVPVLGFTRAQQQGDRTQTGHILGDPQRRDSPDALDTKSMSLTPFTLVRMLTHLSMLLGASEQPQSIGQIIHPPVRDPCVFLIGHLLKDLGQLGRAVGKGADDTATTVHLTLSWTLEPPQNPWPVGYDPTLSTKEARNAWEMVAATDVISPQLKHLERKLNEVNSHIRGDTRVSSNPIMKVMFGDPRLFLTSLPRGSLVHGSAVWSCRERGSLLGLTHVVEQHDGRDSLPLLWRFLQKEAEFRLVQFLPDILALQRSLVKKFQNVSDITSGTIREFIEKQTSVSLKGWYEKLIQAFLNTWNQLCVSLTSYEVKIPEEFRQVCLDLDSELQVLVPRRQGAGLCSTALLGYLVALHNELMSAVDKHTGEDTSYTVSLADLSALHVIRYELEKDLLPLVLSNCQYSMERGQETLSEYDLPKIQQQLLTRFLQGKPRITLTGIPTLVSRHDRNYENIFKDVRGKVTQEPLTSLTSSALVAELQVFSDVCEALSAVELALGFLAMTGGGDHMQLAVYLEDVLQMGGQIAPHILKTLGRCSLKHCVALWQLLTSLKSENMLRLKREPFSGIPAEYQRPLGDEGEKQLEGFLSRSGVDVWLLEMHEFLLLGLQSQRATDTFKPEWSLRDTLASYMERKNLDVPPDVEEFFPDGIWLSQFVETWKFAVTAKQQRGQRY